MSMSEFAMDMNFSDLIHNEWKAYIGKAKTTEALSEVVANITDILGKSVHAPDAWRAASAEYLQDANSKSNRQFGELLGVAADRWETLGGPVQWEVLVGNIGRTYDGTDEAEARATFAKYVTQSSAGYGRAGGEGVTLMKAGEIVAEHFGEEGEED
jgi:hypothetical protein